MKDNCLLSSFSYQYPHSISLRFAISPVLLEIYGKVDNIRAESVADEKHKMNYQFRILGNIL